MGEGQPRYSTEVSNEYVYKYRPRLKWTVEMVQGSDRDVLQKTWVGFKYGLASGAFAATLVFSYEDSPTVIMKNAVQRSFTHGMPWVFSGVVYGLTMSTVANIRQKDDSVNHFFGGIASGAMMGSWYKSVVVGRWCAILFSLTGAIVKAAITTDELPILPTRKSASLNMYRTGWFTNRPDPEGVRDGDKDDRFNKYRPNLK